MIYYTLFVIIVIACFFEFIISWGKDVLTIKEKSLLFISFLFVFFVLVAFSGMRSNVGYDYGSYRELYYGFSNVELSNVRLEPFFQFLMSFLHSLDAKFEIFVFIVAIMSVSIKLFTISSVSKYVFLSVLLYFSQDYLARDMGNIRQGLAIAFCALSFLYNAREKTYLFYIYLLIATICHYTAIIFLLVRVERFFRNRISREFIIFTVLVSIFLGQLISFANLEIIAKFLDINYLNVKLSDYANKPVYLSEIGLTAGSVQRLLVFSVFLFLERQLKDSGYYYELRSVAWIGLLVYFLFNNFEILAVRGGVYFRFFDVFIYPLIISAFFGFRERFLLLILVVMYAFQGFSREIHRNEVFLPYTYIGIQEVL